MQINSDNRNLKSGKKAIQTTVNAAVIDRYDRQTIRGTKLDIGANIAINMIKRLEVIFLFLVLYAPVVASSEFHPKRVLALWSKC